MGTLTSSGYVSPACRFEVAPTSGPPNAALDWIAPDRAGDRAALDAWCRRTGPALVNSAPLRASSAAHELVVVSWNLHAGAADLDLFIAALKAGTYTGRQPVSRFVLLLQEAHRGGGDVPEARPLLTRNETKGRPASTADIAVLADRHGLAMLYVPSMRNGSRHEDRGNAILSTEPLSDLEAIELPFERQRRVAVAATITMPGLAGHSAPLRVASVHLDVAASFRRLWLFGARTAQVRGLLAALPSRGPIIVGGDFNTWFGFSDRSYRAMAAALPDVAGRDRRPTFGPLRLDHVFSRVPEGWIVEAQRLDHRHGSDHYPVLVRFRPAEQRAVVAQ